MTTGLYIVYVIAFIFFLTNTQLLHYAPDVNSCLTDSQDGLHGREDAGK